MLRFIGFLLRIYSFLFHLTLGLFLLALALVAGISHQPLNLAMLPFSEDQMLSGVAGLGLAALLATLLAIKRRAKFLFPLWAGTVVYLIVTGYFFSTYSFPSFQAFQEAIWLFVGASVAFIGALWTLKPRRGRLYS